MMFLSVAPSAHLSMSRTMAFLLPSRGWAFSGLAAFLLGAFSFAVACFFGAALAVFLLAGLAAFLAAAFLAAFWPLGAPFLLVAVFVAAACSGAAFAPCSATAAAVASFWVASVLVFIVLLVLSAVDPRMTIHHSCAPGRQG